MTKGRWNVGTKDRKRTHLIVFGTAREIKAGDGHVSRFRGWSSATNAVVDRHGQPLKTQLYRELDVCLPVTPMAVTIWARIREGKNPGTEHGQESGQESGVRARSALTAILPSKSTMLAIFKDSVVMLCPP